jgi:exodeoxyribonuclease VII large subunit
VLDRGYSLTRTDDGRLVRSVQQVSAGRRVSTLVADGIFESEVRSPESGVRNPESASRTPDTGHRTPNSG